MQVRMHGYVVWKPHIKSCLHSISEILIENEFLIAIETENGFLDSHCIFAERSYSWNPLSLCLLGLAPFHIIKVFWVSYYFGLRTNIYSFWPFVKRSRNITYTSHLYIIFINMIITSILVCFDLYSMLSYAAGEKFGKGRISFMNKVISKPTNRKKNSEHHENK